MAYFPLYIDIGEKTCVVVGGGRIATGKVRQLLEFGAEVTVVAPEVTEEIRKLADAGKITLKQRDVLAEKEAAVRALIEDSTLVVAATDQAPVNISISELCKEMHIPVNVVDEKELCTFFFPAIVKREDVVVAVSTGGTSPALAAKLRRELETAVPEEYGRAAAVMGTYREYVKKRVPDIRDRKRVYEVLLVHVLAGEEIKEKDVRQIIEEQSGRCLE